MSWLHLPPFSQNEQHFFFYKNQKISWSVYYKSLSMLDAEEENLL